MNAPVAPAHQDAVRQAETWALRVAQEAAAQVPAYGRFLRAAGYDARRLRSFADFCALPIMDKASYLSRYPLAERCRQEDVARATRITLSSGSSGEPTLWPRFPEQGEGMIRAVTAMLQDHFRIRERATLLVVCVGIGPWGYGTSVSQMGASFFAQPGVRGSMVTPGLNVEETFRFVEELGPHYDQIVLVGYPAPLAQLLESGVARGIDWAALHTGVLAGGEYMPLGLRERILRYLGKDPERLEGLTNLFGTSEVAGITGYETHLCLLLGRLCLRTPGLTEALFGSPIIPSITQYNPLNHFLQVANGDVLLTMRGAVPLVRYDTHDRGGLLSFDEVLARCRDHGCDLAAELRARGFGAAALRPLPFLYVFGRTDGVIVYGVNVYNDQVAHVLAETGLDAYHTSNFNLTASTDEEGRATIRLAVELRQGIAPAEELRTQYHERVVKGLLQSSAILRAVYESGDGRLVVDIDLVPYGTIRSKSPKRPGSLMAQDGSLAPGGGHISHETPQ